MVDSNQSQGSIQTQHQANGPFSTQMFSSDSHNEAFSAPGILREHWNSLVNFFSGLPQNSFQQKQNRATQMRREDGSTYNLFDDPNQRQNIWELDLIPALINAEEWAIIEKGIQQRALLLDKILADVYGLQNLVKSSKLPAEYLFNNPAFLRPCHGYLPIDGRFLTFYAADLYRGADGQFKVFRDFTSHSMGLGYALENRIVISRVIPELYHYSQVRRLAPFFQNLHQDIVRRSASRHEDPEIVILSPGPKSLVYFEHAFLSRYLNYPLVEGQDLSVRDGEVFLKKLTGLERIESIFRQINDHDCDPFLLRSSTAKGVAGLIQAAREQNVDIINPVGSGFAETPGLSIFLPDLCRYFLNENLIIDNHPRKWCGHEQNRMSILENLSQYVITSALHPNSQFSPGLELERQIAENPDAYLASEIVNASTTPVWNNNQIGSRRLMYRIFACATEHGFSVMPGGLAYTAENHEALVGNQPQNQFSKDIWVISDKPVESISLLHDLRSIPEFKREPDLPSRIADHLLWLGRYLERAESQVRPLRALYRRLSGENRLVDIPELPFLLNLLRAKQIISSPEVKTKSLPRFRELSVELNKALYRHDHLNGVVSVLDQILGAASHLRDWFSMDSWRVMNQLEAFTNQTEEDPLEYLDGILFTLSAFAGLAQESVTRSLGWRFLDMGRRIERATNVTSLIQASFKDNNRETKANLEALLEVAASIMTYRSRYRTTFQPEPVLDLLLLDETNPKSLVFQCSKIAEHIDHLPREADRRYASKEERYALDILTSVRLLDIQMLKGDSKNQTYEPLLKFFESIDVRLKKLSQEINAQYLTRVASTPHFSNFSREPRK